MRRHPVSKNASPFPGLSRNRKGEVDDTVANHPNDDERDSTASDVRTRAPVLKMYPRFEDGSPIPPRKSKQPRKPRAPIRQTEPDPDYSEPADSIRPTANRGDPSQAVGIVTSDDYADPIYANVPFTNRGITYAEVQFSSGGSRSRDATRTDRSPDPVYATVQKKCASGRANESVSSSQDRTRDTYLGRRVAVRRRERHTVQDEQGEENDYEEEPDDDVTPEDAGAIRAAKVCAPPPVSRDGAGPTHNEAHFLRDLLPDQEFRWLWGLLTEESQAILTEVNECTPMAAYALDNVCQITIVDEGVRASGLVQNVMKTLTFMNYYYIGRQKSVTAGRVLQDLTTRKVLADIRAILERASRTSPELGPVSRALGQDRISDTEFTAHIAALTRFIDRVDPQSRRESCDDDFFQGLRHLNWLFRAPKILGAFPAMNIYSDDLRNLTKGNGRELKLYFQEDPDRSEASAARDAAFVICLGNMIHRFRESLHSVMVLLLHQLEKLSETAYLAYLQIPSLKTEYCRLVKAILMQTGATEHSEVSMRLVAVPLVRFLRQVLESRVCVSEDYMLAAMRRRAFGPGSGDLPAELGEADALAMLDQPDLFQTRGMTKPCRLVRRRFMLSRLDGSVPADGRTGTVEKIVDDIHEFVRDVLSRRLAARSSEVAARGRLESS